jgi:hypothetical protein
MDSIWLILTKLLKESYMPFIASTRGSFGPQGRFGGAAGINATGGSTTLSGAYKIHTFNTDGTFAVLSAPGGATIDLLMVGGGGSGGIGSGSNCSHPGGGAGGLIYRTSESVTAGSYPVVIGQGGTGPTYPSNSQVVNGTNTTFKGLTALGGGGGNCGPYNLLNGGNGGSGGGGQHSDIGLLVGGNALQPGSASGGFGFKGGDGPPSGSGSPCWYGGGGGGAGAVGANGFANTGGEGGIGKQYDISGVSTYYAGGGGSGGCGGPCSDKAGGLGGGGTGAGGSGTPAGGNSSLTNGSVNTGGGGGGWLNGAGKAGNGGSGVVIIRYTA